MLITNADGMI